MAHYMLQFTYTPEAWATLSKNPQDRSKPIKEIVEKLGGQFLGLYYCFGEYDGLTLVELPDDVSASAAVFLALTPGHLKEVKTTKLFTVEETMQAMRMAGSLTFRGPS